MSGKILEARVLGGREAAEAFVRKESAFRARMRDTLMSLAEELRDQARARAPMGRKEHAGGLRKSLRRRMRERDSRLTVVVSATWYGRFVEKGTGPVSAKVRGYWRRWAAFNKSGVVQAKSFKTRTRVKLGVTAEGIVFVRPFTRTQQTQAKSFLGVTLMDMYETIMARLFAVTSTLEEK